MDVELIKTLMQNFRELELTDFSLKCDEFELKLGKEINVITQPTVDFSKPVMPLNVADSLMANGGQISEGKVQTVENTDSKATLKSIKSPIVGTFYRAKSPTATPFVEVGSYVHKGDVVCIVEAMKLMNEVEAEEEGEVIEILVGNEEMVEYNQPLILLK
ncbi:MAG: acetyl-CoA carboxylase biotin carboxyl carrier protein [Cellulosilyticum sp.]|nr:acetyl-CoA carboxylase biotin carboxyl carrier protein [Cellulosilyticum sp.]MEE1072760.1 acetyl-CoA carboxylase biotin carboxyl carrier protein [Cellulosilyticum sp.]